MMRCVGTILQAVRRPRLAGLLLGGLALLALATALGLYFWSQLHLGAAEQALQGHDLATARRHLERSRKVWPWNERAQFLAARTARRLDDCATAERLLTAYEQSHGSDAETRLEWQLLGVQQGDLADSERELRLRVRDNSPDANLILEALTKGYLNTFQWSDAMACLDLLLERQPAHAPALVLRARALDALRWPERALEAYRKAVDLTPESVVARLGLADALNRLGHAREAIYHYEILRQRRPDDLAVLLGLARCRFDAHEVDEAGRLLAELPDQVAGLVERGRLALHQDRPAEAEPLLARAGDLAPWHREALRLLVTCREQLGKAAEAQQCLDQLREIEASHQRLARLRQRLREAGREPEVRLDIGLWCLQNGQEEAGVRWLFTNLLLVDRDHRPTHAALADHFEQAGQPRRAAEHRQRAGL
jgi:tetratricopeptide (TPR) repeat protein